MISGLPSGISQENAEQIAGTVIAQAALLLPACLLPPFFAGVAVIFQSIGVLYLSLAAGPQLLGLCLIVVPSLLICGLRFSLPAGLTLASLPLLGLTSILMPHRVWNASAPGVSASSLIDLLVLVLLVLGFGMLIRRLVSAHDRLCQEIARLDFAFQNVAKTNLELQTYALFARQDAIDQERRRVAGEIHDIIGYSLTNLIILIQTALALSKSDGKVHDILESAASQATDGLANARHALMLLRSRISDRARGANLFLQLIQQFSKATGVNVRLNFGNLPKDLPPEIEQAVFRIIQEGLTNSFRHGKASSVDVGFWSDGKDLSLNLLDNGMGSAAEKASGESGGIGLSGLSDLVADLGGKFESGPVDGGFALRISLPLPIGETEHV
jgi:signal transduction histidine kinase